MKSFLRSNLFNFLGQKIDRRIVVFESDDWGTIRMASKNAYNNLLKKGYPVDHCVYNRNDALESNYDIEALLETLNKFMDKKGNPVKFTMNNIVANPDFEKIRKDNFQQYSFEPFTKTLERYPDSDKVLALYDQGRTEGNFQFQFHGREHLNINRWLNALQNNDKPLKDAFQENMFTVARDKVTKGRRDMLDSFGMAYSKEFESMKSIINSGTQLFSDIWKKYSGSFIAPCYTWPNFIEPYLMDCGIKYIQGNHVQKVPKAGLELKIKRKYHWLGQENNLGQQYLVRNVLFEPTEHSNNNVVDNALNQVKLAFFYGKPAVICTHRVNYTGRLNEKNRSRGITLLKEFLQKLVHYYPDVEFMSSDELGKEIQ
jgi:hypothetical protein